jgi:predicted nucleic acid-binding protein
MTQGGLGVVIDSSVALASVLDEPESAQIHARLGSWIQAGVSFLVPAHFWLEVVNVLGRTHGMSGHRVLECVHLLDDLEMTTVEIDRVQLMLTIGRVERYRLTAYDAAYLALAHSASAKLATLDRQLADAAGADFVDPLGGESHRSLEERAPYSAEGTWPEYRRASAYLGKLRLDARSRVPGQSRDSAPSP